MNNETFEFVVYIIHQCANKWHVTPAEVYQKIKKSGCLSHYLIPLYDILHTQSPDFVVADIEEYMENRGVAV